jgi:hypothetical protein
MALNRTPTFGGRVPAERVGARSHSLTVLTVPPTARVFPSGENATQEGKAVILVLKKERLQ